SHSSSINPSTSLGTTSNVGRANPSSAVRQAGNIQGLLVIYGVDRRSVRSGCCYVKGKCRCRDKDDLIYAKKLAVDEDGRVLVWTGAPGATAPAAAAPAPLTYTPPYLPEQILTPRAALEGERKQVTVLFADLKGSTELIRDLDPEQAQALLDPALQYMMDAVHRFEGTVNQVLGDGIMALFGAPVAHEDHAVRACYAALA